MATKNPHVQLEASFSAEGVREGTNEAKQALTDMANVAGQQADRAARSLDSLGKSSADMAQGVTRGVSAMGDGVQEGVAKFTRGEAAMASSIRRLTEQAMAATKVGSSISDAFAFKIDQRGLDASKFTSLLTNLRDAESALSNYKAREAEVAAQNVFAIKHQQAKELAKASDYANWWADSLKKVEEAERRAAGQSSFLANLKGQADAIGKTRSQLLELQAAQMGVTDKAAPFIARLREQETQLLKNGVSVGQTAAAMRMLPAQFTDIFVSLQGGMPMMTVMLQQGGQIKDMFGGIGPAARAMGTYVAGLVNPFTLTATAAGVLAFAMYKAESSLKAANSIDTQLRATGRGADISREQIASLRKELQELPGVTKAFADATISEFARTRQIGGALFRDLSLQVADYAAATNQQVPDAAKALARAFADPAQGAKQLDEQLGILSASQLVAIENLTSMGDRAGAQKVLLEALTGTIKGLADDGMTPLGKATDAFGDAWDRAIGGMDSGPLRAANEVLADMIGAATWLIDNLGKIKLPDFGNTAANTAVGSAAGSVAGTLLLGPTLGPVLGGMLGGKMSAPAAAPTPSAAVQMTPAQIDAKLLDDQVKSVLGLTTGFKSAAGAADELKGKAAQLTATLASMRAQGKGNTDTYKELEDRLKGVNEKIEAAAKKAGAGARQEQSAYETLIASINAKIAANEEELKFGGRVTEADKLRLKMLAELEAGSRKMGEAHKAEALSRLGVLDAQEKEKQARAASVEVAKHFYEVQNDLQAAAVAESKAREAGQLALNGWLRGIEQASQATEVEIAGIGRSAAERQKLIDKYQVQIDLEKQLQAIQNNPGLNAAGREVEEGRAREGAGAALQNKDLEAATKRLNDLLDPDKAKEFGDALSDAFSGALSPLKRMTDSLTRYGREQTKITQGQKDLTELVFSGKMDSKSALQAQTELDQQALSSTMGLFGDLTGAAKSFFDEQSTGYKTLQTVSAVFNAAQLAMTTAQLVPKAISAVLGQGQGEPYTAFARMAAMAAFVASLGVSVGGGGGGGGGGGYTGIKAGGTGTVLGMEGEQSESIGNAIEILADNSKIELGYTQKMLAELTKVREGILGLAATASTDFFIRGFAGGSFGDDFLDSGIGFHPGQTVADIIRDGVQGVGFNLIFQNGAQPIWKALDEEFTTGVGRVLANVADVVFTAADALGLNDEALAERMLSLMPVLGDTSTYAMNGVMGTGGGLVSLKDMNGEEIAKELEAIFSGVADQMAREGLPTLRDFQRVGEGAFETVTRVTTGIESAGYALEKFGLNAIDYTDIVRKQGDIAVEIMRQTITGAERELAMYRYGAAGTVVSAATPKTGLAEIIEDFVGDAGELEDLYASLMDVRKAMKSVGMDALDLSRDMIRGAGGLETLQSGLDSYFENFFSEEEKLAARTARLAEDFQRIGVAVPVGIEGFRAAVDQADEYLKGQLMGVADAFYEVASASGEAAKSLGDIWADMVGRASDFLTPGQMQAQSVQRIQSTLAAGGVDVSFEQILGYSRAQFAADIQAYYAAGNEEAVRLMHSIADDYLAISQSTVDALQAQQTEASAAVDALQADVDKWAALRKSAQDLSRAIGLSLSGGTGEADLWATVNGTGEMDERLKAATELKALIERTAATDLQARQAALSSAQNLLAVGKQLNSFVAGLKVGALTALTPAEQMGEARRQYQDTLLKAQGGDRDAQGALQNIANSYLQLAQQYDPNAYGSVFASVTGSLDALGTSLVSGAQAEIDRQQSLITAAEAANGLSAEQITKLTTLQTAVNGMTATADVKLTTTNAELTIANGKLSAIESLLTAANDVWTYLPVQADGIASIDSGVSVLADLLGGLPNEIARSMAPLMGVSLPSVPGFASGGIHAGGWRMVGERGPELEFTGPARIYSNGQSSQMLAGANAELIAELRAVKAELAAVKATIAQGDQMNAAATMASAEAVGQRFEKGLERSAQVGKLKARATA